MSSSSSTSALAALPPSGQGDRLRTLLDTVRELGAEDLLWLSGFAAGVAAGRSAPAAQLRAAVALTAPPPAPATTPVTVLFGTHSGNSKKLAERLAQRLGAAGATARLVRLSDYQVRDLAKEKLLVLVVATHGDGDPADDTRSFYDFVLGRRAPRLPDLRFAVLGLGDASYPKFCHVARTLDERLAELGARRLTARGECDVELEKVAAPWIESASALVASEAGASGGRDAVVIPLHAPVVGAPVSASAAATRSEPALATVLVNQAITARAAHKRVLHLELGADEQRLAYQTGDALAIWPENPPAAVAELVGSLGLDGDALVARDGRELPLARWLGGELEITRLSRPFLAAVAERTGSSALASALAPTGEAELRELLATRQVLDVLAANPARWTAAELVAALRPLAPRSYSISSSALAYPGEIHLTVAHVAYDNAAGQRRVGSASDYLARSKVDDLVRAFVEPNPGFRPPAPDADLIMVGPGTGVAPFRAFVQERELAGATGRSWLFFGEQSRRDTFLYQLEWQDAVKRGALGRLDLAFSRDGARKVYVQHRLRERGKDVWAWLERGAHFYVCGDAKRMAPDVEAALLAIAREHGGKSEDGAAEFLAELRAQGRYHRDVY